MKTILVVEDEISLSEAIRTKLEKESFNVLSAHNGEEGLQLFSQNRVDFILLDIMMPKMDGVQMVYELRKKNVIIPPIIMLTNLTNSAIPEGITKVLQKSQTSLETIVTEIKSYL